MADSDIPFRSYKEDPLTVGELLEILSGYPDDTEVDFGSTVNGVRLLFYRVERSGDKAVLIELSEDFPAPGEYKVVVHEDLGSCDVSGPHIGKDQE